MAAADTLKVVYTAVVVVAEDKVVVEASAVYMAVDNFLDDSFNILPPFCHNNLHNPAHTDPLDKVLHIDLDMAVEHIDLDMAAVDIAQDMAVLEEKIQQTPFADSDWEKYVAPAECQKILPYAAAENLAQSFPASCQDLSDKNTANVFC